MLLSENSLKRAIRTFYFRMRLQRPENYSAIRDLAVLEASIPAFIEALKEIETVNLCHGFDPDAVFAEEKNQVITSCRSTKHDT